MAARSDSGAEDRSASDWFAVAIAAARGAPTWGESSAALAASPAGRPAGISVMTG